MTHAGKEYEVRSLVSGAETESCRHITASPCEIKLGHTEQALTCDHQPGPGVVAGAKRASRITTDLCELAASEGKA